LETSCGFANRSRERLRPKRWNMDAI